MELKVLLSSSSKGISLMQFEYQPFRKGNGISQNEEKQRDLFDYGYQRQPPQAYVLLQPTYPYIPHQILTFVVTHINR